MAAVVRPDWRTRDDVVDFGGGRGDDSAGGDVPIVLLHGLIGRATTWWHVAQWLRDYGRVVGLDARGHGRLRRPGSWRSEEFVDDVAELITQLDQGPAVVIGHSMGGLHAGLLAALYPQLTHAVVIEDMAPDNRGQPVDLWRAALQAWPEPFRSLAQVREFFGRAGDYFVECVEEHVDGYRLMADVDDLYRIASEWAHREYWSLLEKMRCPLLVVEAGDTVMPAGQQAELAARVPDGRHIVVPGAAHIVHDDAPQEYRGAVEAFLSEIMPG